MVFSLTQSVDINSYKNNNPSPPSSIYPTLSALDANYHVSEEILRSAIFIPSAFKHGKDGKVPVLLVPGTGSYGGEAFSHNFAKLLLASSFGDPVWLNVKGRMCDASVSNAEHFAYAINYLSAVCNNKKIAVVAWSQGNLGVQWSLKYFPSTRDAVANFICLSADFRGTVNAWGMAPFRGIPCTPSVWHQTRSSNFIMTLLSNDGDSAYVPTTSIYSRTDEIVQPQFGKWASALMHDVRGVGVTNCEVQVAAALKPAGTVYTHETLMINPLAWELASDAICNGGPGRLDRIDMSCCMLTKAKGLNLYDVARTQALTLTCGKAILTFLPNTIKEPTMPKYCMEEKKTYVPVDIAVIEKDAEEEGVVLKPVAPVGVVEVGKEEVPVVEANVSEGMRV
ncbi:putative lipase B [Cadophora sp. MPI-SDFR-AT-0126]|nr:putative lipase B [Leotiomycetes sp. MPI-SDFR-AT-0126]